MGGTKKMRNIKEHEKTHGSDRGGCLGNKKMRWGTKKIRNIKEHEKTHGSDQVLLGNKKIKKIRWGTKKMRNIKEHEKTHGSDRGSCLGIKKCAGEQRKCAI